MSPLPTIATIVLALGAVEATAYWWMHPAPAGLNQPVLVYQPGSREELSGVSGPLSETKKSLRPDPGLTRAIADNRQPPTDNSSSSIDPGLTRAIADNRQPPTDNSSSSPSTLSNSSSPSQLSDFGVSAFSSTLTPLPAVVEKALPTLRCSTGTAARIDRDDGVTIHLAFFEWNLADSTNVLEAFKHLPDECMGSIGMTLVSKEKPRFYTVKAQQDALAQSESSSSSNQQSPINNHQSGISPTAETLWFDHTVFRDAGGISVHAFKGTWVSGANSLIGDGFRGGADQWTQLRWKSALKRFHPAHARVAQGAVRGIPNPDLAWAAFEDAMLKDLTFAKR